MLSRRKGTLAVSEAVYVVDRRDNCREDVNQKSDGEGLKGQGKGLSKDNRIVS